MEYGQINYSDILLQDVEVIFKCRRDNNRNAITQRSSHSVVVKNTHVKKQITSHSHSHQHYKKVDKSQYPEQKKIKEVETTDW